MARKKKQHLLRVFRIIPNVFPLNFCESKNCKGSKQAMTNRVLQTEGGWVDLIGSYSKKSLRKVEVRDLPTGENFQFHVLYSVRKCSFAV